VTGTRSEGCPNHVARATSPADVLAGIFDGDREIIPSAIVSAFDTGWALGYVVVPHGEKRCMNMVEYAEFWLTGAAEPSPQSREQAVHV
jgi:hypothetical protein